MSFVIPFGNFPLLPPPLYIPPRPLEGFIESIHRLKRAEHPRDGATFLYCLTTRLGPSCLVTTFTRHVDKPLGTPYSRSAHSIRHWSPSTPRIESHSAPLPNLSTLVMWHCNGTDMKSRTTVSAHPTSGSRLIRKNPSELSADTLTDS